MLSYLLMMYAYAVYTRILTIKPVWLRLGRLALACEVLRCMLSLSILLE